MKRLFVYTPLIISKLDKYLNAGEKCRQIENEILKNPEVGSTVAGTGGVKKFRIADELRGKGKRGGLRVFYLDLPHLEKTHLLYLLSKGDSEDLTISEKGEIRALVAILKKEN